MGRLLKPNYGHPERKGERMAIMISVKRTYWPEYTEHMGRHTCFLSSTGQGGLSILMKASQVILITQRRAILNSGLKSWRSLSHWSCISCPPTQGGSTEVTFHSVLTASRGYWRKQLSNDLASNTPTIVFSRKLGKLPPVQLPFAMYYGVHVPSHSWKQGESWPCWDQTYLQPLTARSAHSSLASCTDQRQHRKGTCLCFPACFPKLIVGGAPRIRYLRPVLQVFLWNCSVWANVPPSSPRCQHIVCLPSVSTDSLCVLPSLSGMFRTFSCYENTAVSFRVPC